MKNFLSRFKKKYQAKGTDFFVSSNYWEQRYAKGGNSGAGSYNRLAEFKAQVLNEFCVENTIKKVLEIGCGDGNQLKLSKYNQYVGLDISKKSIEICTEIFRNDLSKEFYVLDLIDLNDTKFKADLVISLDVVFHLVEDNVYHLYMDNLFNASSKHVIIYSSNYEFQPKAIHVRHRKFTDYIEKKHPEFKFIKSVKNKYPFDDKNPDNTSFADFYFYERVETL